MLKKLALVLMLLSAPLAQARMVMGCSMMPTQAPAHCCCEDEVASPAAAQDADLAGTPCCSMTLDASAGPGMAAVGDAAGKKTLKDLWNHSPDLATAPLQPVRASLPVPLAHAPAHRARPAWDDARRTYLSTARLRL